MTRSLVTRPWVCTLAVAGSVACASHGPSDAPGASSGSSSSGSGGGGSSGGATSPGGATTGGAATSTTPGASSTSASSAASSTGDPGAQGVTCHGAPCDAPMACCQVPGNTSTQTCTVTCANAPGREQICTSDADCQQTGTSVCTNGVCTDMGKVILGVDAGAAAPTDAGSPVTTATSDGGVPTGYPTPTTANRSQCTTVPISATACAGSAPGVCIECLFGGSTYNSSDVPPPTAAATSEAGNYLVTVQVGGSAAGQTTISAESQRGLLAPVATRAGQSAEYAFAVNVRGMEGQPNHAGGFGGYPGLDLFFWGPAATPPQVTAIGYQLAATATTPIMVYIASDSTACDQTGGVYGGWGQMITEFFAPPIAVANYANSGASSSSFIASSALWGGITSRWKAGDYVFIQFGHNDKGIADSVVQANLEKYVTQAKAAHVTPILVSPPARVQFVGNVEGDQSSLHAVSAKAAAAAQGVAFIDLTALSTAWYNSIGSQSVALTFHALDSDATHTNLVGAEMIASLVAKNIKDQNLPLAKYLR